MKAKPGRCEGRKPYGANEGEQATIVRMKELRALGVAYDRIAATPNCEGVPTRTPGEAVARVRREPNVEEGRKVSRSGITAFQTRFHEECIR